MQNQKNPGLVLIGSTNTLKINAFGIGFLPYVSIHSQAFKFLGIDTPSGVPTNPVNENVEKGARNRLGYIKEYNTKHKLGAKYLAVVEGGTYCDEQNGWQLGGVVIIAETTGQQRTKIAHLQRVDLPPSMWQGLTNRQDIEKIVEEHNGVTDIGHKEGITGWLTAGGINRDNYISHAVTLLLVPFLRPDLFQR